MIYDFTHRAPALGHWAQSENSGFIPVKRLKKEPPGEGRCAHPTGLNGLHSSLRPLPDTTHSLHVARSSFWGTLSNGNGLMLLLWRPACQQGPGHAPHSRCSPAAQRLPWPAGCPSHDLPGAETKTGETGRWAPCFRRAVGPEHAERSRAPSSAPGPTQRAGSWAQLPSWERNISPEPLVN